MTQNLWDTAKAVVNREAYSNTILPQKTRKITNKQLNLISKATRERKTNKTRSQQKERSYKIRAEINEIETKKTIPKINKTKSWFFEKIKKIDKPLGSLFNKEQERTQINKIRNEKGEVTTDTTEIQRMVRNYKKQLYTNKIKWTTWNKWTNSQKAQLYRLNQEEIENINRPMTSDRIETVIKNHPTKVQDQMASQENSTKYLEKS